MFATIARRSLHLLAAVGGLVLFAAVALLAAAMLPAASSLPPLALVALFLPAPLVYLALLAGKVDARRRLAIAYLGLSATLTAAMLFGVAWVGTERAIHPAPCTHPAAIEVYPALAPQAESVRFASREGTRLAGWFVPGAGSGTVLLLHGYGCRREEMLPHAEILHAAGYSVLLFDFRSRGESDGNDVTMGYFETQDALGALDYLRTRRDVDAGRIGVLGVSLGGAVAILAAAEDRGLRVIVAESAFRSMDSAVSQSFTHFIDLPSFPFAPLTVWLAERRLGIRSEEVVPERAVATISPRPLLLIHGAKDATIGFADGEAVFAAAGQPKSWWLIPDAGHANGATTAPAEYAQRILAFFESSLR